MWDYYDIKKEKQKFGTSITPKETVKQIEKEFKKVIEDIAFSRSELQRLVQTMSSSEDVHKAIGFLKKALEHLR